MRKPTVAIVGASANRNKFGNKSVRAHVQCGYEVFPINPREREIEGATVYATIGELPVANVDRVSLYVPAHIGKTLLESIRQKGCRELWLNPGSESQELIGLANELGLNVLQGCSIVALGVSPADFP